MTDAFARRDKLELVELGRRYGVPAANPAAGAHASVRIVETEQEMAGPKAPQDGIYTTGKARFRIKKGDPLPDGATFVDPNAEAQPAETPEQNGDDHPKWYLDKLAKAEADGVEIPEREEGETKAAYEARVDAMNQPGPSETAESAGPSEQA